MVKQYPIREEFGRICSVRAAAEWSVTLDDSRTDQHYTDQLYLRDAEEMRTALADYPDAVENTLQNGASHVT